MGDKGLVQALDKVQPALTVSALYCMMRITEREPGRWVVLDANARGRWAAIRAIPEEGTDTLDAWVDAWVADGSTPWV